MLQSSWNWLEICLMLTVVSACVPSDTRLGRAPKPSFTLSPVSDNESSVAAKSKLLDVSPELNVTLAGTPE